METPNQSKNLDSYSKWESTIDTFSFAASGALTCLVHEVSLIDPTGLGILLSAGTNALGIAAINKLLDSSQIESRFLRVCAIVAALALSTLALPFLISSFGVHSFVLLSVETAIELGLMNLIIKIGVYTLFKTTLFFKDYLFFTFPKNLNEVMNLEPDALLQVKTHLLNFPGKATYLSLPFQIALNKKLSEKALGPLPYVSFSDLGKDCSREELRHLHAHDLSKLPLHKKAALAELFMHHNFPPQERSYTKHELPEIDSDSLGKTLSQPRALWYHLILRLNSKAPLYPNINEQFYKLKLPPPRENAIDLPLPTNENKVEGLSDYQIPWYYNLFKEQPEKWSALSHPLQAAFNKRFSKKITPVTPILKEQPSSWINWKTVTAITLIGAGCIAAASFYHSPTINAAAPISYPEKLISYFSKEKIIIPKGMRSFLFQPVFQTLNSTINSALMPYFPPQYRADNLIFPLLSAIENVQIQNFSQLTEQSFNLAPLNLTTHPLPTSTFPYASALITALATFYAIYKAHDHEPYRAKSKTRLAPVTASQVDLATTNQATESWKIQNVIPEPKLGVNPLQPQRFIPGVPSPKAVVPSSSLAIQALKSGELSQPQHLGIKYRDTNGPVQILIDLNRAEMRAIYARLRKQYSALPSNMMDLAGKTLSLKDPRIIAQFEKLALPTTEHKLLQDASVSDQLVQIEETQPHTLKWEAFNGYIRSNCPGIDLKTAKGLAKKGLKLIQNLRNNVPVDPSNLDQKLLEVCWGLMAHAINKDQAFVEGTFDIKDPGNRIFDFFLPSLYGRSSSHYPNRALKVEKGKWRDYKHFGADLTCLPAGKRTVMLGKIATLDGTERTYLKMENWGANLHVMSDPKALPNLLQVVCHTLEFFESAAKKTAPSVFGDVGGGLNMRKEHMLQNDLRELTALIAEVNDTEFKFDPDYGFQAALPFLEKSLNNPQIDKRLEAKIRDYLDRILKRYDNCLYRKGNEVNLDDSIMHYAASALESSVKPVAVGLEDSLVLMESDPNLKLETEEEKAAIQLRSTDYISSKTVSAYASCINMKNPLVFVEDFLFPAIIEQNKGTEELIKKIHQLAQDPNSKPIFIPFILQSSGKQLPIIGSYFPDHIVTFVLDPGTKTIEYYNSQSGDINFETRKVLGANLPANDLVKQLKTGSLQDWALKSNSHAHQTDYFNCGAFICLFMKLRAATPFDEVCKAKKVDISTERLNLANDLDQNPTVPAELSMLLEKGRGRICDKSAEELLDESMQPYLKEGKIQREALFDQIQGAMLNGSHVKDAQAIFDVIQKTGRTEEETLKILTLLQPGAFASLEMDIARELTALGAGPDLQISNIGPSHYEINTEGGALNVSSSTKFEAKDSKGNSIFLNATVKNDLLHQKAIESWNQSDS